MASRREQIISAVETLVRDALPFATVQRDAAWPKRAEAGGTVIIRDGDPGEPEVTLGVLSYTYTHDIPLEVFGPAGAEERHGLLDDMLATIGDALEADRSLGGLTEWLEPAAAAPDDVTVENGQPIRAAIITVTAIYSTPSPLG